ncbi:hypothetical protein, partial [Crocosphaera sp.]|uniref:hypothetical protein n=1 Tax=Crocosphaera sp. TaxID=2729996 RepID=UPI002620D2AB
DLWLQQPNGNWSNLSAIETFEENGDFTQEFSLENYQLGDYGIYGRAQDRQGVFSDWFGDIFSVENQTTTL